jgi:hypothetical protein
MVSRFIDRYISHLPFFFLLMYILLFKCINNACLILQIYYTLSSSLGWAILMHISQL